MGIFIAKKVLIFSVPYKTIITHKKGNSGDTFLHELSWVFGDYNTLLIFGDAINDIRRKNESEMPSIQKSKISSLLFFIFSLFFYQSCSFHVQNGKKDLVNLSTTSTPVEALISLTETYPTPTPQLESEKEHCLIFSKNSINFISDEPDEELENGLYEFCENSHNLSKLAINHNGPVSISSISPDNSQILIIFSESIFSDSASLYLINLNHEKPAPIYISEIHQDPMVNNPISLWIDETRFIFVSSIPNKQELMLFDIGNFLTIPIDYSDGGLDGFYPFGLLFADTNKIIWYSNEIQSIKGCPTCQAIICSAWQTNIKDNSTVPFVVGNEQLVFNLLDLPTISPDKEKIVWVEPAKPDSGPPYDNYLNFSFLDNSEQVYSLETLTSNLDLKWFPDSSNLLVLDRTAITTAPDSYKDYETYGIYKLEITEKLTITNLTFSSPSITKLIEEDITNGYQLSEISPDGDLFILQKYDLDENMKISVNSFFINLSELTYEPIVNLFLIGNSRWLPYK